MKPRRTAPSDGAASDRSRGRDGPRPVVIVLPRDNLRLPLRQRGGLARKACTSLADSVTEGLRVAHDLAELVAKLGTIEVLGVDHSVEDGLDPFLDLSASYT